MIRAIHVSLLALLLALAPALRAQDYPAETFRSDFQKALQYDDQKGMDQATKKGPQLALLFFEELYRQKMTGNGEVGKTTDALLQSWSRACEKGPTMENLQRWLDRAQNDALEGVEKARTDSRKLWNFYESQVKSEKVHDEYAKLVDQYLQVGQRATRLGHMVAAAEIYSLASVIGNAVPGPTIDDQRQLLAALEAFLKAREDWGFTFDVHYIRNKEFTVDLRRRIDEKSKAQDKRKSEGYAADAKGIDSLVVAGAAAEPHALKFEPLAAWDAELDYAMRGGPVQPFWWIVSLAKEGSAVQLNWFTRTNLYLMRLGAAKFGISTSSNDLKQAQEIDASGKAKASQFFLDADKKVPYAMFFWTGTDKERVGDADCNLAPTGEVANVYFRSAASWKTQIGTDPVVLYDDNADGTPGGASPFEPVLRSPMLGDAAGEGTPVARLDSMRIGKGPRVPFSEFVKIGPGWFHARVNGESIETRPLNPEYVKTGKIKLVWSGPKPAAPVQLVVQGEGDYRTALFDVAGGKEVEVPAATYAVIYGRVLIGKGARAQTCTIHRGSAEHFAVEPGKTFELKMGAPFTLQFERTGDDEVAIDGTKILLREATGCVFTELHGGLGLAPEVLVAKGEDGKGAKTIGKFGHCTDGEIVNAVAKQYPTLGLMGACLPVPEGYKEGPLVWKGKLPAAGMKVGLTMKKHPLFGVVNSAFH